jgi:hypothetical protein
LVLAAVLVTVVGFGAGFLVGRHAARSPFRFAGFDRRGWTMYGPGGMPAPMPGGVPGYGGGAAGGGFNGRFLAGTVTGVQGDSFTVRTLRGDTATVVTSSSTVVHLADGSSISDLQPGSMVIVAGTPNADGTITATHVIQGMGASGS